MTSILYKQVIKDFLGRIEEGKVRIGDRLPPEAEFAKDLGVSRSTLRLAFSHLEKSGVLQRRKRGGTQVIASKPVTQFTMVTHGVHDVLSLGRETELHIDRLRLIDGKGVAELNGLESSTGQWLEVTGNRVLPQQSVPFNWSRLYVDGRFADIEDELQGGTHSVFQVIEQKYQISVARVRQQVHSIACPADIAIQLGVAVNSPMLQIVAMLEDSESRLVEVSVAIFDPNRFQLTTDVRINN